MSGWIVSLALLALVAPARAVPSTKAQTKVAHWLGSRLTRGGAGPSMRAAPRAPSGKARSCEFRTSIEDKVLAVSRRGDLLRVEPDRCIGDGAGDRCGGLLPVPRSGRLVLLIGGEAFLRDGTRNWQPGWNRIQSGIGVHAVPADARRPLGNQRVRKSDE